MMELQAHQGNMQGIQLYSSRCSPYTFPITRIPRPLFLDSLHSRHNNTLTREKFQAWVTSNKSLTEDTTLTRISSHAKPGYPSSEDSKSPLVASITNPRPNKPFMATAAFPDDIPRFVEIEFAAFQHEYINHHLSYRDPSNPEHTARTIDFYKHCMQHIRTSTLPSPTKPHDSKVDLTLTLEPEDAATTEGYSFCKVVDPDTREIIAFVKSEITTLTPEIHASPLDVGHETEPEMNRAWFALNEEVHRAYCGSRQHVYFGMLATHPSHQHRGAATSLMHELIAEADALGLEIYCEATNTGLPMYEKYGFVPVKTLRFDPAEYGVTGLGVEVQTVMVRGVLGRKDGVRKVEGFERFDE